MAVNVTTLGHLLVNVYDKETVTALQNLTVPFLSHIGEATDYTVGGNGLYFAVNASGDEGYGFIAEEGGIPTPQNEQTKQAVVTPAIFVGASRITGLARAISSRDAYAFANGLQYHLDYKLKRMTRYWETALFRSGDGLLALINGAPPADTTTTNIVVDTPGALWLRRNMFVDFFNPAGPAARVGATAVQISFVDLVNNGFRTSVNVGSGAAPNPGLADNDEIFLAGTQPVSGAHVTRELLGITAGVNSATTGTYLGIDRATIPEWQSNSVAGAGAAISEDILLQAENRVLIIGGVDMASIRDFRVVMHPNQRRKYFALVAPQKQFTGLALDAGYSKLTWNGHEFVETYNCHRTKVFMGDFSQLQKFTAPDGDLKIDTTFGPPIKWAQGFDAGLAYWRAYCNYAIRKPNSWVEIDNLQDVAAM